MTLKRKIIHISSINDIDTKVIDFNQINNFYVDQNKQYYATKYNLRTHKIDVVPIVRGFTNAQKIMHNKQKMIYEKDISNLQKLDKKPPKQSIYNNNNLSAKDKEVNVQLFIPLWIIERDYNLGQDVQYNYDIYIFNWKKRNIELMNQFNILINILKKINQKNKIDKKEENKELDEIIDIIALKINSQLKKIGNNISAFESSRPDEILKQYDLYNNLTFEQKEYISRVKQQGKNNYFLEISVLSSMIFKAFEPLEDLSTKVSLFITNFSASKEGRDIEIFYHGLEENCSLVLQEIAQFIWQIFQETKEN